MGTQLATKVDGGTSATGDVLAELVEDQQFTDDAMPQHCVGVVGKEIMLWLLDLCAC